MLGRTIFSLTDIVSSAANLFLLAMKKFYWTIKQKWAGLFRITGCFMVITKTPGFSGCRNCHHSGNRDPARLIFSRRKLSHYKSPQIFRPCFLQADINISTDRKAETVSVILQHCGGCVLCYGLFSVYKRTEIRSLGDGMIDQPKKCLRAFKIIKVIERKAS
jgi:hypothetical protein